MKFTTSIKMVPLMLSLSTLPQVSHNTGVSFSFDEGQISKTLAPIDLSTFNYIKNTKSIIGDDLYINDRFKRLLNAWNKETMFSSQITSIIENKNFKRIVSMGEDVVPFILKEINQRPSNLVWALNAIFNSRISKNQLTVKEACKSWVKWGLSRGQISQFDLSSSV